MGSQGLHLHRRLNPDVGQEGAWSEPPPTLPSDFPSSPGISGDVLTPPGGPCGILGDTGSIRVQLLPGGPLVTCCWTCALLDHLVISTKLGPPSLGAENTKKQEKLNSWMRGLPRRVLGLWVPDRP